MAALTPDPAQQPITNTARAHRRAIHPVLVTVPIAAWLASLVFDIASRVSSQGSSTLVNAAYWLIAAGVIGATIAALFGIRDLLTIPRRTHALRVAITHMFFTTGLIVLFAADWWWRHVSDGYDAAKTHPNQLALNAVCIAILAWSSWLGGTNDPGWFHRRVSPSGQISVAAQRIQVGKAHARKLVTVHVRADVVHIDIDADRGIDVPRTGPTGFARFNAGDNEELAEGPLGPQDQEAWQAEVQDTLYGSVAGDE